MINFIMSAFRIPKGLLKDTSKSRCNYWWVHGVHDNKKFS